MFSFDSSVGSEKLRVSVGKVGRLVPVLAVVCVFRFFSHEALVSWPFRLV